MNKETYQKNMRKQKRTGEGSLCCVNCGEDNPSLIEMHHPYGKNNSKEVQPLCKNCHYKVTKEQNKLAPKARSKDASPQQKIALQLVSIGAELVLFGTTLIDIGHEMV
jgi:hypothetical protein